MVYVVAESINRALSAETGLKRVGEAINALRAYLYEFGCVAPKGIGYLPRLAQVVKDPGADLPDLARDICRMAVEKVELLTARLATVTAKIAAASKAATMPRQLQKALSR